MSNSYLLEVFGDNSKLLHQSESYFHGAKLYQRKTFDDLENYVIVAVLR
jgi:hypothetical protein